MEKHYEKIVKTFYEGLEEGRILGRKCTACDHVEFPPYLACNSCGNLDTEWQEISGKAIATQIMPSPMIYADEEFENRLDALGLDYCVATVKPENSDEYNTCLIGTSPKQAAELQDKLPVAVKPIILQASDDFKMVYWELA